MTLEEVKTAVQVMRRRLTPYLVCLTEQLEAVDAAKLPDADLHTVLNTLVSNAQEVYEALDRLLEALGTEMMRRVLWNEPKKD